MENISKEKILSSVKDPSIYNVTVLEETVSTSTLLKELAENGAPEGTVIIAEKQTGGRGRLGRSFFSPQNSGIYMSFLVRPSESAPSLTLSESVQITAAAACAVCEAIKDITGVQTGIKWVNDVYRDGKKLCGILTEASLDGNNLNPKFISVGIGINVYLNEIPSELADIATAIYTKAPKDVRNALIARLLDRFYYYYHNEIAQPAAKKSFISRYKELSVVKGKRITVIRGSESFDGTVEAINDDCTLSVRTADGKSVSVLSGEISIRPSSGDKFL